MTAKAEEATLGTSTCQRNLHMNQRTNSGHVQRKCLPIWGCYPSHRAYASLPPLPSWSTPYTYLDKILFKFIVSSETPVFTLRLFSWPCLHPAPPWSMFPLPHPKWLDVSSKTPDMCIWNSHVSTEYFNASNVLNTSTDLQLIHSLCGILKKYINCTCISLTSK